MSKFLNFIRLLYIQIEIANLQQKLHTFNVLAVHQSPNTSLTCYYVL